MKMAASIVFGMSLQNQSVTSAKGCVLIEVLIESVSAITGAIILFCLSDAFITQHENGQIEAIVSLLMNCFQMQLNENSLRFL